jgi:hypothetical protein
MIDSTAQYQAAIIGKSRRIYIRAVIDISDPDMIILAPVSSSIAPWTVLESLQNRNMETPERYATFERNRWLLDGATPIIPDDNSEIAENSAYTLNELSGDDGTFTTAQTIQQMLSNVDVLQAFSVYFSDDPVDGVAEDFTVDVGVGGQSFYSMSVTGNTKTNMSFDGFTVYAPTDIKVTVTKWSLPGRRVRIIEIIPGIYETWDGSMLAAFDLTQQGKFDCLTLPYGTLNLTFNNKSRRFEPRSKNGLFQSLEERQGIEAHIGVKLEDGTVEYKPLGIFYQYGDGWKTGDNSMSMRWALVDIVGLLANRTFILNGSMPTTLSGWIAALVAQLGTNFANRYSVDENYANLAVTASSENISGKSCGDILRWACMVTGTWPRADSETGYLTVEPLWKQGNRLLLRNLVSYPTMKANESIAALIFKLDGNGTEYIIGGNSTSSEKTVTVQNPFIHTKAQAIETAKTILSCYGGNLIETEGRGDPAGEIGDVDTVDLDESSATTGRRMYQTFTFSGGVLKGCKSQLLQADGSYLYQTRVIFTEDSTWTVPENVTKLRVILGGGGTGSAPGEGGKPDKGTGWYDSIVEIRNGRDGADGSGGKIWYDTINVNPGMEFTIKIGKGGKASNRWDDPGGYIGEPTLMGTETTPDLYSSDNGQLYDPAYTDIANGDAYGRSGITSPRDGTSDGAKGGAGGSAPVGEFSTKEIGLLGYWYEEETPPGKGAPGKKGADGFCLIYYDKEAS